MEIKNNIRDKVFVCPKCGNKALVPIEMNENTIGIDYHDLCICEECDSKYMQNLNLTARLNLWNWEMHQCNIGAFFV